MLEPVIPVSPAAPYVGGKRNLSKRLVERINAVPHTLYAEPFVGMGGVFFKRTMRPKVEAINDISRDVALLFRWLQRHYQQVIDVLKWQICSRADFDRLMNTNPETLTELERVARFLFLQRSAFGGKVYKRGFGVSRTTPARFDLAKLVPMLEAIHERLNGVQIECLTYAKFIDCYDSAGTLFYLDPPYIGSEHYYGPGLFMRADFELLRDILSSISGRFMITINDHNLAREVFVEFNIEEVDVNYRISSAVTPAKELIITNY